MTYSSQKNTPAADLQAPQDPGYGDRLGGGMDMLRGQLRHLGFEEQQALLAPGSGTLAPSGATPETRPYVRLGSTGPSVMECQAKLNNCGEALGVDGIFGQLTQGAVHRFQSTHGLDPDAIVGPLTWAELDRSQPQPVTPPGKTPPGPKPPEPKPPGPKPPGKKPPGKKPPGTDGPKFNSSRIQRVYETNKLIKEPTEDQVIALRILDRSASGPWAKVKWWKCQEGGAERVFDANRIQQGGLGVCGPAVIVNAMADSNPVGYANFVHQIFTTAMTDGERACDDLLANEPLSSLSHVDWMVLCTMRDAENGVMDYSGEEGEGFDGMTMPGEVEEWMTKLLGCVDTTCYTSYMWGEVSNTKKVNALMQAHPDDVFVNMMVDGDALRRKDYTLNVPNHFVRLLEPITFNPDGSIDIRCFSWGYDPITSPFHPDKSITKDGYQQHFEDEDEYEDVLFEFIVGAKKPGIL